MRRVVLFSKPGCPLCDEAREVLDEVRTEIPFDLSEVNILADDALFARYRYDIPVIALDGVEAFKHRVDARALKDRLS